MQELYLAGNQITQLPPDLFRYLLGLEYLDLRNNKLRALPTAIGYVAQLSSMLLAQLNFA